jgi:hypothetical protein
MQSRRGFEPNHRIFFSLQSRVITSQGQDREPLIRGDGQSTPKSPEKCLCQAKEVESSVTARARLPFFRLMETDRIVVGNLTRMPMLRVRPPTDSQNAGENVEMSRDSEVYSASHFGKEPRNDPRRLRLHTHNIETY